MPEAPPPDAGQAVGAPIERLDGAEKVAGTEIFGADVRPPEAALMVRAVRSPLHAAAFSFGDLEAWRAARPGVTAVFTAADIPGRNRFGVIPPFADQPALAEGHVRFRGEAVALVAGEPAAMEALDLADFPDIWTEKPHNLTLPAGADDIHPERPGNVLISGYVACGDVRSALAGAVHVVEGTVDTAYVEHAYIEPEAGMAWMEGDTLVIRACTQAPAMDRDDTAAILGLPPERVRMIPTAAGGGFGAKLDISLQPLIGLVTLKTGRPARMAYSRHESMISTTKRHPGRMRARIGADAGAHRGGRGRADRGHAVRRRFQHRRLCELGADGGQPGACACLRSLFDAGLSRRGAGDPHQRPAIRRLSRLWRAAGGDPARDALRRSG